DGADRQVADRVAAADDAVQRDAAPRAALFLDGERRRVARRDVDAGRDRQTGLARAGDPVAVDRRVAGQQDMSGLIEVDDVDVSADFLNRAGNAIPHRTHKT